VFDTLGKKVIHMGPNGSGAVAKLAHNTIVGINNLALAEGFAIAAKSGIPADNFLELVQLGSAGSKAAELKGRKIIEGDFSNQFSLALMLKDLKLASSLTDGIGMPSPMLNLAKSLFQTGASEGYGEEDLSAVVKCYEAWIGQKIGEQQP
ncbi:NAD-binding protein, partial [Clostridium perfringens]